MFIGLLRATATCFGGSLPKDQQLGIPIRPTSVDINSHETIFHSIIVSVNKCGGSYNTIDDPYAQVCVSDKGKIWMWKYLA